MLSFFLLNVVLAATEPTPKISEKECREKGEIRQTIPAPVNLESVLRDLSALKDDRGRLVFQPVSEDLKREVTQLLTKDAEKVSKIEQFYGLAFLLGKFKSISDKKVVFAAEGIRHLLISSKVFSAVDVPNQISEVVLFWNGFHEVGSYEVKFKTEELALPLNNGKGFFNFREGLCQIAEALIFYGGFDFEVTKTRSGNIHVSKLKNLDLKGTFGSRGIVDVDIQFVSVKSVEFIKDSPMGIVRAKVAQREWDTHEHSRLLRMVASLVTDKSTQPIDW